MARPRNRKLKVFQTQVGFHEVVVAAPSQTAALRALGVHQNLFASGDAKVTTDPAAVAAASAHPETPLRRAVGSDGPFELEPTALPTAPEIPKGAVTKSADKAKPARPARPPADRSALDAAEAALGAIEAGRKREAARLDREDSALKSRKAAAQARYDKARAQATAAVSAAREAYRKAAGDD
jgi:hypothetical protein